MGIDRGLCEKDKLENYAEHDYTFLFLTNVFLKIWFFKNFFREGERREGWRFCTWETTRV